MLALYGLFDIIQICPGSSAECEAGAIIDKALSLSD